MKKALNIALLISFIVTILVPVTGVRIHKLASSLFLLLSIAHIVTYRKGLGAKRWLLLILITVSFATGLFGMLPDAYPVILQLHKGVSVAVVFFLAIHIFLFHHRLFSRKNGEPETLSHARQEHRIPSAYADVQSHRSEGRIYDDQ